MSRRLLRNVLRAGALFALIPLLGSVWTQDASALTRTDLYAATVTDPDGTQWLNPAEAQGNNGSDCNAPNPFCYSAHVTDADWLLASKWNSTYAIPVGQMITHVYVNVFGRYDLNSTNVQFGLSIRGSMTRRDTTGTLFDQTDANCAWRAASNGWDLVDPRIKHLWTALDVNNLDLATRRYEPHTYTNQGARISIFRVRVDSEPVPTAPSGLAVTGHGANSISLAWSAANGLLDYYLIDRSPQFAGGSVVVPSSQTSYTDGAAVAGQTYSYTVKALYSWNGYTTAAAGPISSTSSVADHLGFVSLPLFATAGVTFAAGVRIYDQYGQAFDGTNAITIGIQSGPPGSVLTGSGPVSPVTGIANFHTLSLNKAGMYVLSASANPYLTPATAPSQLTVTPGDPAKLALLQGPAATVAGAAMLPALVIEVRDNNDNPVTNISGRTVGLQINIGPPGAQLFDQTSATVDGSGRATFSSVRCDLAGYYQLQDTLSSSTLKDSVTTFGVTPAQATGLQFVQQPVTAAVGSALPPVSLRLHDSYGNTTTYVDRAITLSVLPLGAVLSGTTTRSTSGGVVTFDDLRLNTAARGYRLVATPAGLHPDSIARSNPFDVLDFRPAPGAYLAAYYAFNDADATCQTRDWKGEDLATPVYAHVTNRWVSGNGLDMGTQALWFGADATSGSPETDGWVVGSGYGNNWSQRLTSPSFASTDRTNQVFSFQATVDFTDTPGVVYGPHGHGFLAVQGRTGSGAWTFLRTRWTPLLAPTQADSLVSGRGALRAQVVLGAAEGNNPYLTQLRIVVQTDSTGSAEDGGCTSGRGAAQVDSLAFPALTTVTFDDGSTGGWLLSAENGPVLTLAGSPAATRDVASPGSLVTLKYGPALNETQDSSCLWTFLSSSPGSQIASDGTYARIVSPWLPVDAGPDSVTIGYSARLNTLSQRRIVRLYVRGKNAGDTRPRFVAMHPDWLTDAGAGTDYSTSFVTRQELRFPYAFGTTTKFDSIQIVFRVEDRAELLPGGFSGRTSTSLPFLDDVYVTIAGADLDEDGVAALHDACSDISPGLYDPNGNGCPDSTLAVFNRLKFWRSGRPIHFAISAAGEAGVVDGSDATAIRRAAQAWRDVAGAQLQLVEDARSPLVLASAEDGTNLVTFQDPTQGTSSWIDDHTLAVTTTTYATVPWSYRDSTALPGQIVDCDIRFNATPGLFSVRPLAPAAGQYDLQTVATHELGHLLGLAHSPVASSIMYPQLLSSDTLHSTPRHEDSAALCALFPGPTLATQFASATGRVYSDGTKTHGLRGAMVLAIHDVSGAAADTTAVDYTSESGAYRLTRLVPGETYKVYARATTLDERSATQPLQLTSGVIDHMNAKYWTTDGNGPSAFTATAGGVWTSPTMDIVQDLDVLPPSLSRSAPPEQGATTDWPVDQPLVLEFSEPMSTTELQHNTAVHLHLQGAGNPDISCKAVVIDPGARWVLYPNQLLQPATPYALDVTTSAKDLGGNGLPTPHTILFTTARTTALAPTLFSVAPRRAGPNALVTLVGDHFDPSGAAPTVRFGGSTDATPVIVTQRWMTVRVPANLSGIVSVAVKVGSQWSNSITLTVEAARTLVTPVAEGGAIPLQNRPDDVVLMPDASTAFVVGPAGFAAVPHGSSTSPTWRSLWGAGHHLALLPDASHVWMTQPDSGRIVRFALPQGGTLPQVDDTLTCAGQPDGIVIAPWGYRAYTVDRAGNQVLEWDIEHRRVDGGGVLRQFPFGSVVLDGGIALHPSGKWLLLSSNSGIIAYGIDPATAGDSALVLPGAAAGPRTLRVSGSGIHLFASGGDGQWVDAWGGLPAGGFQSRSIACSGTSGVSWVFADSASALLTTSAGQLALIRTDDAARGTLFATATTGASPSGVAVDEAEQLAAVASVGSSSLQFYGMAVAAPTLTRLVPAVAQAGEPVVALCGGDLPGGTQAVLDGLSFTTRATSARAAAFTVDGSQVHSVHPMVSLAWPTPLPARVSNTLALEVVPALSGITPRTTGLAVTTLDTCTAGATVIGGRKLAFLRGSPTGALLALVHAPTALGSCSLPAAVTFVRTDDASPAAPFGTRVATVSLPVGFGPTDAAFRSDGTQLWLAGGGQVVVVQCNLDAGAFSLGSTYSAVGATAIVTDFMDRYVAVTGTNRVTLMDFTGAPTDTLAMGSHSPTSLLASRDGRYLWIGGEDRLWCYDPTLHDVVASTRARTGRGIVALGQSTDGSRILGTTPTDSVGVWNASAGAGAVELFFGRIETPADTLRDIVPSPTGAGVLARIAGRDSLLAADLTGTTPVVTTSKLDRRATASARSLDGRLLWLARSGGDRTSNAPAAPDTIDVVSLAPVQRLLLAQGNGQAALAGSTVPAPLQVHAVDANGLAVRGACVRFSLADASQGSLDGVSGTAGLTRVHLTDADGLAQVTWTLPTTARTTSLLAVDPGSGASFSFAATATQNDAVTTPRVLESGPSAGAGNIAVGSPLFARFNEPMLLDSLVRGVKVYAAGQEVAGQVRLTEGLYRMVFEPQRPLPFGTPCRLWISNAVRDTFGLPLGPSLADTFSVGFTTQSMPPLALRYLEPSSGQTGTYVNIVGAGFDPIPTNNIVKFGGYQAVVTQAYRELLEVVVPQGASTNDVSVMIGGTSSTTLPFTVLPGTPPTSVSGSSVSGDLGARDLDICTTRLADGRQHLLAYVVNPARHNVAVYDITNLPGQRIWTCPAGDRPVAIVVHPDGKTAYVANYDSKDASVLDLTTLPVSGQVWETKRIPLPGSPNSMTFVAGQTGSELVVTDYENGLSTGLATIDVAPLSASCNSVNTAGTTKGVVHGVIVATNDGQFIWQSSNRGARKLDLHTLDVVDSVGVDGGLSSIDLDHGGGGVLYGVDAGGDVRAIDVGPTSPRRGQTVGMIHPATPASRVKCGPDGQQLFVGSQAGSAIYTYLVTGGGSGVGTATSSLPFTTTLTASVPSGAQQGGIALDPAGTFGVVANEGSPYLTRIELSSLPTVPVGMTMTLDQFDIRSITGWAAARLEPPAGYSPGSIKLATVRLDGLVAADTTQAMQFGDTNGNGLPEISAWFRRDFLPAVMAPGDSVVATISGALGDQPFVARDTIRVRRGTVGWPTTGVTVQLSSTVRVTYDRSADPTAIDIMQLQSLNNGNTWSIVKTTTQNTGAFDWRTPSGVTDSLRVGVLFVDQWLSLYTVRGVLATSSVFSARNVASAGLEVPARVEFVALTPNPALGSMRFRLGMPQPGPARIEIYDLAGRRTRSIWSGTTDAGWHEYVWDGRASTGTPASPGVYLARLQASGRTILLKRVLLR